MKILKKEKYIIKYSIPFFKKISLEAYNLEQVWFVLSLPNIKRRLSIYSIVLPNGIEIKWDEEKFSDCFERDLISSDELILQLLISELN